MRPSAGNPRPIIVHRHVPARSDWLRRVGRSQHGRKHLGGFLLFRLLVLASNHSILVLITFNFFFFWDNCTNSLPRDVPVTFPSFVPLQTLVASSRLQSCRIHYYPPHKFYPADVALSILLVPVQWNIPRGIQQSKIRFGLFGPMSRSVCRLIVS